MSRHWRRPRRQPTPFGMMRPLHPPRRLHAALDAVLVLIGLAGICWFLVEALWSLAGV